MEYSAGIVLFKHDDLTRILALRIYNNFDLPKGKIEDNETSIDAALRETFEEASINDIEFPWGYDSFKILKGGKYPKQVELFVGTTKQEPKIVKNPMTGKFEHHEIKWLTLDEASEKLHSYMQPAVDWVRQKTK